MAEVSALAMRASCDGCGVWGLGFGVWGIGLCDDGEH